MKATSLHWSVNKVLDVVLPYLEWLLLFSAVVAFLVAFITGQKSELKLEFDVYASDRGSVQVYFTADGRFTELQTHVWPLQDAVGRVSMKMPTRDVRMLRIDPSPGMVALRICNMRLTFADGTAMALTPQQMRAVNELTLASAGGCVVLSSSLASADPQAVLDLSLLDNELDRVQEAGRSPAAIWTAIGIMLLAVSSWLIFSRRRAPALERAVEIAGARLFVIYLVLALMFGSLLAFVTPPGAVPDEPAHTAKIILVENGQWLGIKPGQPVSPSLSALQGPFQDFLNPALRFDTTQVFAHAAKPLPCEVTTDALPSTAAPYSPTLYMLPSLALNLACRYDAKTGTFIYGARLANLLVAVLLTAIGIHFAGGLRWPIFVVALLPMTLAEQASLTADSPILGLSLGLVGLQAGLATGVLRPGPAIEFVLFALGLSLAVAKPGYAWVCVGFIFSVAVYRRAGRRFSIPMFVTVVLPWLVHIAWVGATVGEAAPRAGVDPAANIRALYTQPLEVLALFGRTFLGPGKDFLWSSLVGRLGWIDVILHPASYALAATSLLFSLGLREQTAELPRPSVRSLAAVLALGAAMLPVLPMYLFWTPFGAILIEGLQGRYFLPALAFLLCWLGFKAPVMLRAPALLFTVGSILLINVDAVFSVAYRYYA